MSRRSIRWCKGHFALLVIAWWYALPFLANACAQAVEPGRSSPPVGVTAAAPSSRRQVNLVSGTDLTRLQTAETIAAGDVSILADQTSPIDLDSAFRLAGVE